MISVVLPIGPFESNIIWLKECIDSIDNQTVQPTDIVIVSDGAQIDDLDWLHKRDFNDNGLAMLRPVIMPWRTGISHAFNYGIAYARNDLVMMLGSDDTLEPNCLQRCVEAYNSNDNKPGYYTVPIKYLDTQEVQTAPCNAAMITRDWFLKEVGGFPIETAVGAGDNIFLSIALKNKLPVYWVGELTGEPDKPLYNYRRHPAIHTYKLPWNVVEPLRDHLTETWNSEQVKEWSDKYGV